MAADTLDRLLKALAVQLHAFSICEIQRGWSLAFPAFEMVTVHYVLEGSGALRVGNGQWLPFAPRSVLIVPARQSHVVGEAGSTALATRAEDHCSMLADGLVTFTSGDGSRDILLLCGTIPAFYGSALGFFDLLREPMIEDVSASAASSHVFELMLAEVTSPSLGTQAMTEMLMKQCMIMILRRSLPRNDAASPLFAALHRPQLARAVLHIIEDPAAPHSVESLASFAGMSRTSFAGHFAQAFQQGPIDFVQKARLCVAERLLTTTDLPIKVIATSVGYASRSYFSRSFRAAYGIDPKSFRDGNREGRVRNQTEPAPALLQPGSGDR